ncbi:serpin B6-like [Paramacrobiotus metropolitanus]|uniref:serpin B6-like n=1 Tax=Paramacrobiotus metropolitanus TaxID=2943436 RepID=UPI002445E7F6|nr:serpin B6-like [Paramacrobiotus metropolitanus]
MGKFLDLIKSCLGRAAPQAPRPAPRKYKLFTKDFSTNPHSRWAVAMFQAVTDTANTPDANFVASPYAAEVILTALFPDLKGPLHSIIMPPDVFYFDGNCYPGLDQHAATPDGAMSGGSVAFYDDNCRLEPQPEKAIERAVKAGFIKTTVERFLEKTFETTGQFIDGKITLLLTHFKCEAQLHWVNIVDFTGQWEFPFEKADTISGTFYCANNEEKTVEFMRNENGIIRWLFGSNERREDDPQMILLDIVEGKFTVMLLLPAKRTDELDSLEKQLTIEKLLEWRRKSAQDLAYIVIPKFRISCDVNLQPVRIALGLKRSNEPSTPFCPEISEEDSRQMCVSQFRQQVTFELDEYGINAAPADYCRKEWGMTMLNEKPDVFVDRPFLMVIWDEMANVPVFMGRITDPSLSGFPAHSSSSTAAGETEVAADP